MQPQDSEDIPQGNDGSSWENIQKEILLQRKPVAAVTQLAFAQRSGFDAPRREYQVLEVRMVLNGPDGERCRINFPG